MLYYLMVKSEKTNESHTAMVTEEMKLMWESTCLSNKTLLWLMQNQNIAFQKLRECGLKTFKTGHALKRLVEKIEMTQTGMKK